MTILRFFENRAPDS